MAEEDKRYDGILMTIIQQQGNINGFFDALFSFLRRNTDFFQNQKKAEEIIVQSCKKHFDLFQLDTNKKKEIEELKL